MIIIKAFNKVVDKIKYKHPWDRYYDKDKRTIEVPNVSLYEYLRDSCQDHLNIVAINYFNKKWTFKSFLADINICARALRSQGIRAGDVVTICMPNTPEAVISFYAVNEIGAIANMVHPLSAEEEIKHSLISTKSVMLIAINLSYKKVKERNNFINMSLEVEAGKKYYIKLDEALNRITLESENEANKYHVQITYDYNN